MLDDLILWGPDIVALILLIFNMGKDMRIWC